MEGEYSSKVEAGLWMPYDIKIMFLSLRYHTSLFSSDMFAHSRLILDEYTSVQRTDRLTGLLSNAGKRILRLYKVK